jgi:hypothetical protein
MNSFWEIITKCGGMQGFLQCFESSGEFVSSMNLLRIQIPVEYASSSWQGESGLSS